MPGVLATIAQQGQSGAGGGGGGGTVDPSIATSASGNYNNAVVLADYSGSNAITAMAFSENGSNFSSDSGQNWSHNCDVEVNVEAANELQSANNRQVRIFGYIREGDAGDNSPTWSLHSLTQEANSGVLGSLSNGADVELITSSYNDYQDNTLATRGYTGIGAYVKWNAGGGRGGLQWGANGDEFTVQVKAQIDGTDTSNLKMTFQFE